MRRHSSRVRRGFTLIEALAAVVLLGVGLVASLGALSAIRRSEYRAREAEVMLRLASDKYQELVATGQTTNPASGDFSDRNDQNYRWSLSIESSGVTDLNAVTVIVQPQSASDDGPRQQVSGLVYVPPATTGESTP